MVLHAIVGFGALPGARVVHCLRDPIEACWSCDKQLFAQGALAYTSSFASLAHMWALQARFSVFWEQRSPSRYRCFHYESLGQDPDRAISGLLDFCGLDPQRHRGDFHPSERSVRTPSAGQVRRPLNVPSPVTPHYGLKIQALRSALLAAALEQGLELELAAGHGAVSGCPLPDGKEGAGEPVC